MKTPGIATCAVLFGMATLAACYGQGLTGQLGGTVADPAGAMIAGAKISLTNADTSQTRNSLTDPSGNFLFADLLPGSYRIAVEAAGFKRYEQPDITLSATERVTLRQITLQLGQVTEVLSVTAEAARLQTQSSERSGLIDTRQIQDLALKGRDYLDMMQLLPGVTDSAERDAPGFTISGSGNGGLIGLNVNGNKEHTLNVTLDGISALETGSQTGPWISPSLDAIGEMKVLLTNYQAEYGRSSGGTINIVIKNGTKNFHGSTYYFFRDASMNANKFFNNRQGIGRDPYHYNDFGYTLGGPLLIPKLQHRRDKLFFFWSEEFMPKKVPQAQIRRTMPTALERRGDFSQTLDTNGRVIRINDPLANGAQFPGNIIPTSRIDKAGQGLLNVFAMPNAVDPLNTFNYLSSPVLDNPWHEELIRVDYNISSKDLFYFRLVQSGEDRYTSLETSLGATNWPQFNTDYRIGGHGLVTTYIHTFSPSVVNELTFGVNRGVQRISPRDQAALDANDRQKLGINLPQLYPQYNPLHLLPNATFGGVSNAPALAIEARFPYHGNGNVWNWSDNLTKVWGKHNIKLGIYIENASRNGPRTSTATGAFAFARDVNNPLDTNYAFSNAILGSVQSYSESDFRPFSQARYQNYEWFAQDSWRVSRRLTFEIGARFYKIIPTYLAEENASVFVPSLYDPSKAPALIQPYKATPASPRMGINPLTGEVLSPVLIGTYAPGSGNPNNGMRVSHEEVIAAPPISVTPRFGFAWDVFGNGKMAVRGGFGIFLDRVPDTNITAFTQLPPVTNTLTAYNTTITQLLGTRLTLSPSAVNGMQLQYQPQSAYNWSFGIQRDIGFGTVLDVAYVGNAGRHLQQVRDLNATPYGTNYLPSSQDPTSPGSPLPVNFLRPIQGYAGISYYEDAGTSNYNSMQTQVNKRFGKGLKFGATWTWSKAMDYGDTDSTALNPFINIRVRNYGKAGFDHTHNLAVNYIYKIPRAFAHWDNSFSRMTLDGWELSGITSFISGTPMGFTYSLAGTSDITGASGGGVDTRVILASNPNLPYGDRSITRAFNTDAVRPPLTSNFGIGNAPKDAFRGPGRNKWNISLFKNIPFGKSESRRAQIRLETYNTFNHPQFSAVDTAARFDATGKQINSDFGWYTATAPARIIQLGLKIYF